MQPAADGSQSASFGLLDERIQRFIWAEGWKELRDVQETAIPAVLQCQRDVIIAAATASGKTEAAFFPALTHLLQATAGEGLIVYVSPLKALINDQFSRLERLCEQLEVPVWPWHGDIGANVKQRFLKKGQGVLLITPESLEALLCTRGTAIATAFARVTYFVIDELHAFIGSERGKQLQSLLHRLERVLQRRVPRIGLSATLGDMSLAADFLRPSAPADVQLVESKEAGGELRILVKGYEEPAVVRPDADEDKDPDAVSPAHIAEHLFKVLRGSNNLVFPNSRNEVERYTHLLNTLCERDQVPTEFWPHHGSLSKELRTETERALKQKTVPATAVCTNTLELGIDIGAVKAVAQIGPPPSVASLRQRLGRSGRRPGEPAILRGYCIEDALQPDSSLATQLRLKTVKVAAMISLLLEGWYEPPKPNGMHLSTLVQQVLSAISQYSGATAGQLYALLCAPGTPFARVPKEDFIALLRHLGAKELLVQESSGLLLHGTVGEKFVNHYSFYAAFASEEEYRVVSSARTLGSMPVRSLLTAGQRMLFAGRTWYIEQVDDAQRVLLVSPARGKAKPSFTGDIGRAHTRVHQRMRELLESQDTPVFLDAGAARFLQEGRQAYQRLGLHTELFVDQGSEMSVFTWLGDDANEALACLLRRQGLTATLAGPAIDIVKGERGTQEVLDMLLTFDEPPPVEWLLEDAQGLQRDKWDWALPETVLQHGYASQYMALDEALAWAQALQPRTSED